MNPCVKTGCCFQDAETGLRYSGDLFHDGQEWQVRGFQDVPTHRPPDIIVSKVEIRPRPGSRYCDTNPGIHIDEVTDEFRKFVAEWYPYLHPALPPKGWSRPS